MDIELPSEAKKICGRCNENLPVSSFLIRKQQKGQLSSYCRGCNKETSADHKIKAKKLKLTRTAEPAVVTKPTRTPPGCQAFVYFVQEETDGPIKIGYTDNPFIRLSGLQVSNPRLLTLIGSFPGDREVESILHNKFYKNRIRGEWFHPSASLIELIKIVCSEQVTDEVGKYKRRRAKFACDIDHHRKIKLSDDAWQGSTVKLGVIGGEGDGHGLDLRRCIECQTVLAKPIYGTDKCLGRGRSMHYRAVLTEESATKVIKMIAGGEKSREISERLGITKHAVNAIRAFRTWKHLPRNP